VDVFGSAYGLSNNRVYALFEDHEGNIWISTIGGLDRFRDYAVATFSESQGFPDAVIGAVAADPEGGLWVQTTNGLTRWDHGQVTAYRDRRPPGTPPGAAPQRVREMPGTGLPDRYLASIFQDDRGRRLWISAFEGVGYLENDRFTLVKVPGVVVNAITRDNVGNLWVANQNQGLFRLSPGNEVQQIPWTALGRKGIALVLAADPAGEGLWLGFGQGGIAHLRDGQISESWSAADGLGDGRVNGLRFEPDGTLWAATEGGLSRLKNGRVATLTSSNGLPCDSVLWALEDNAHAFWLYMTCGLVRVARSELDAWVSAVDKAAVDKARANKSIRITVFDSSDGVRTRAMPGGYTPHAAKTPDGKLWFSAGDGLSMVDPLHLPTNKLPPPVEIEQITADRKTYAVASNGSLGLPPLVRDLEIDYTALSLAAPEKIRFRYKLEGRDRDWQDAGNRRQAFYSDLSPRSYRFRVAAANNSGVWNEAGASLDFSVAPAYYQTNWFRLSIIALSVAFLAGLYQLRLRQLTHHFEIRMEERVNERTRIARDLHDTLLQSFQGLLLKLHAVTYMISERPEAKNMLEGVIEQARQAITEGRNALEGLRTSTIITNDLALAVTTLGDGLAADQSGEDRTGFRVQVEGASRHLAPLVRDEVYRIAVEALRNAFRHAKAKQIEVEIRYGPRQLRLRVRDDGKGIDQKILDRGGRDGHYGVRGMNERARLVGGKLAIWSEMDSGTEVELSIPASVAYGKSSIPRRSVASEEVSG
jgi:signal transduction histidine kinase/streptogramin lyase